jgi:hypothetical protein
VVDDFDNQILQDRQPLLPQRQGVIQVCYIGGCVGCRRCRVCLPLA